MSASERMDVFALLGEVRSDHAALGRALTLFVEREDYGFVWIACDENDRVVGCVLVSYAISAEAGALVADLDDCVVAEAARGTGVGLALLDGLADHLRAMEIARMRASAPRALALGRFFAAAGFVARGDERYSRAL